jgi:hypothetical protein
VRTLSSVDGAFLFRLALSATVEHCYHCVEYGAYGRNFQAFSRQSKHYYCCSRGTIKALDSGKIMLSKKKILIAFANELRVI